MPVRAIHSPKLWTCVEHLLREEDEHVCVLPMTTFIKPVRVINLLQTDTTVTAAATPCPPGSVNLEPDGGPLVPKGNARIPLYRLYRKASISHFYTIHANERDNAIATLGYDDHGVACHVLAPGDPAGIPLYRLYRKESWSHFYTIHANERDNAIATLGYDDHGIECAVYPPTEVATANP